MARRTDPASWRRVREIFDAVVSLTPAERRLRLTDLCADDPDLRQEVESLLSHDSSPRDAIASVVAHAAHDATDPETVLHAGQTLLHYTLAARIGEGGMGVVWKATDRSLGRDVAIKVLPAGVAADGSRLARFEREAKALAALNHANVAAIYSVHAFEGVRFLAMEYVEGEDLAARIARGALPLDQTLAIARQIADALEEAHEKGIVHRDLKPANVKLKPDGKVKVLDFGLAKALDPADAPHASVLATQAGLVMGTGAYMPPEQARGLPVDKRADNWAFGVLLFEMLSGRRPFAGATLTDVLAAVITTEPDWRLLPASTPPSLVHLIRRCLQKDVRHRLRDIGDARIEIDALIGGAAGDSSVPTATGTSRVLRPRWREAATFVLGAAAAVLVVWLMTRTAPVAPEALWMGRGSENAAPASATQSIAVLPFVDLSAQKDQQYFADGLTEDLLNALANNPQLRVAGRTSAFQFRNSNDDPREIGQKLNVVNLLEGSVRKTGNRVRITAGLVNATNGFNLWSETYDREMNDIFAIQADIAQSVADALRVTLLGGEQKKSAARGTKPPAYNAYLQGRYFRQLNTKESLEKAVQYFGEAVVLDPDDAPSWTGLALAYGSQASEGYSPVTEGYEKARKAVEHALELDPNLGEAHAALAFIRRAYDWDWAGADVSARRALELEPGNGTVILGAARVASGLGRLDEALDLTRRAAISDPLNVAIHYRLARYAYFLGRLDEAVTSFTKVLELNPEYPAAHKDLALVYVAQSRPEAALAEMEQEKADLWRRYGFSLVYYALGRHQEADATLAELVKNHQQTAAFQIAEVYGHRGEVDRAFEWLERAYAQRDSGLSQIKGDPHFKQLERDPRYAALLKKMHLPL